MRRFNIQFILHPSAFILILLSLFFDSPAHAGWFNTLWPFRRPVEIVWDSDRTTGDEVAMITFYTGGHGMPNGQDIRVALPDGELVASKTIMTGPGDVARVLFAPVKGQRTYYVYFGNNKPEPLPVKLQNWSPSRGVFLETKVYSGGNVENPQAMAGTFEKSQQVIGRTIIDRPFQSYSPFGEQPSTISKLTGSLYVSQDAEYVVAEAADDLGSLWLDGKPVLFARNGPPDARFNTRITLNRGPHAFVFYHVNFGGAGWFTVGWKGPSMKNYDVPLRDAFGWVVRGNVGGLEMNDKVLVADFSAENQAECFVSERYSHRYRFTAHIPKTNAPPKFEWDFGDGQTATGEKIEHVYLTEGVYPVRLTARLGPNSDVQTTRVSISRNYDRLGNPAIDDPADHSKLIESYNVTTLSPAQLTAAVGIHIKANRLDAALKPAERLASIKTHPDPRETQQLLRELTKSALAAHQIDGILKVWQAVPQHSDLYGAMLRTQGQILLWWKGDFSAAGKLLAGREDNYHKRLYGQALILSGKADEGRKVLLSLPAEEAPERQVAISGAMARTTEYFITEKDAETGEETWERWQQRYPSDFLEGYSALLRVRLIELRHEPQTAARVAEGFALAMPGSSYAPALLDQASRLLEKTDPGKSKALRELLKTKYPEDPLANK